MNLVIELDGSRIFGAVAQGGELGMRSIESTNVCSEFRRAVLIVFVETRVALRACFVGGGGQAQDPFMFDVTACAGRCEGLFGVVNRAIMAGKTGLVGGCMLESRLGGMARAALLAEQRMRSRDGTSVVGFRTARQRMPAQPPKARQGKCGRQNAPPPRNGAQLFEVVEIDALRELFCGARASRHLNTSAP